MKNYLKVDDQNRRLIMDRMFDKNRRIVGSDEYDLLQRAKADYKGYTLVLRHIKTNPEKQVYKNLTYAYMREYITRHNNNIVRLKEFEEMMLRSKCHAIKYPHVKEWFLAAYPEIYSGISSRNNTPLCARLTSPGFAFAPPPVSAINVAV